MPSEGGQLVMMSPAVAFHDRGENAEIMKCNLIIPYRPNVRIEIEISVFAQLPVHCRVAL